MTNDQCEVCSSDFQSLWPNRIPLDTPLFYPCGLLVQCGLGIGHWGLVIPWSLVILRGWDKSLKKQRQDK